MDNSGPLTREETLPEMLSDRSVGKERKLGWNELWGREEGTRRNLCWIGTDLSKEKVIKRE